MVPFHSQVGSGFDLDGRRALVAYRRYLMFLLWMRMVRREDLGEVGGPLAVRYVSCELDSLETIIRKDAGAFLAGPEEVRGPTAPHFWVLLCRVVLCCPVLRCPALSCVVLCCVVCCPVLRCV